LLFDTTILIDFLRNKKNAVEFIEKRTNKPMFTTEINIYELFTGVFLASENNDLLQSKVFNLISSLTVLQLDRTSSVEAGKITANLTKIGLKIEQTDTLIAAIALTNGISNIVTANKNHYERIPGIKVISY